MFWLDLLESPFMNHYLDSNIPYPSITLNILVVGAFNRYLLTITFAFWNDLLDDCIPFLPTLGGLSHLLNIVTKRHTIHLGGQDGFRRFRMDMPYGTYTSMLGGGQYIIDRRIIRYWSRLLRQEHSVGQHHHFPRRSILRSHRSADNDCYHDSTCAE